MMVSHWSTCVVVNAAVEERERKRERDTYTRTLPAKLSEGINALESTELNHIAIPASKSISLNVGLVSSNTFCCFVKRRSSRGLFGKVRSKAIKYG